MDYTKKVKKFTDKLLEEEKSPLTVEKYKRDVERFLFWLGERALTKKSVLEYKEYIITSFAPASVNSYLSSLNAFFEFIKRFRVGWCCFDGIFFF